MTTIVDALTAQVLLAIQAQAVIGAAAQAAALILEAVIGAAAQAATLVVVETSAVALVAAETSNH